MLQTENVTTDTGNPDIKTSSLSIKYIYGKFDLFELFEYATMFDSEYHHGNASSLLNCLMM